VNASQVDRAVTAKRAAGRTPAGSGLRYFPVKPGTRLRTVHRRSRGTKLTATMRSGDGSGYSAWTRSPDYWTDPKWSRTVSDG
jgi:hypothetical protein